MENTFDVAYDVLDEIALEGLDGITIYSLFIRLSCRKNFYVKIDDSSKKYIWEIVARLSNVNFYSLPEERKNIPISDPSLSDDQDRLQLAVSESEIYHISPVTDSSEVGSCPHFKERKNVTEVVRKQNWDEVEKEWGACLVVVADCNKRVRALCGDQMSPDFSDITTTSPMDYIFLETIGRSRARGLNTAGPGSAQTISKDARGIFYHVSHLLAKGVIKKVTLFTGARLVLTRFTDEFYVKMADCEDADLDTLIRKLISELKSRPNFRMTRSEVNELFPSLPKKRRVRLFNGEESKKYIRTMTVPYRELYPEAPEDQSLGKTGLPKQVPCIQLISPDEEPGGDPASQEDDFDDPCIDQSNQDLCLGMPFTTQLYRLILAAGTAGINQRQLETKMAVARRVITIQLRKLVKSKTISSHPVQNGRQRTLMYTLSSQEQRKPVVMALQQRKTNSPPPEVTAGPSIAKSDVLEEIGVALPPGTKTNESNRKLLRMGLIMRQIKANRAVLFYELARALTKEEEERGYKDKMDRRSLKRILQQMTSDGLIKTEVVENRVYYTDLTYDPENMDCRPEVTTEVSTVVTDDYLQKILIESEAAFEKFRAEHAGIDVSPGDLEPSQSSHTLPKFLRLSILHDLLYYMVRGYSGDTARTHEDLLACLESSCQVDDVIRAELPRLYSDHTSCYMFIPPLSTLHQSLPGWCSFVEVMMNAPLSVYAKLVHIPLVNPELIPYLQHPLRCHYPIRLLPPAVRFRLLDSKQFSKILADVRRLCFMGLIRFGPKGPTRKGYMYSLYVNTRAFLLDTTSSAPGYMEIERDRSYHAINYFFHNTSDVKAYWVNLFNVCLETKLGSGRGIKKAISMVREFSKDILMASLQPVTISEAEKFDVGSIPGDQLGAGGIDSSLLSFLRRNWVSNVTREPKIPQVQPPNSPKPKPITKSFRLKKRPPRPKKKRPHRSQNSYDDADLEAMKQMKKLRVHWSQKEDNILVLCKAGMDLLTPQGRCCISVSRSEVRTALRRHTGPESLDKTQFAVARRIAYLRRTRRWSAVTALVQMVQRLPEAQQFLLPLPPDLKQTSPEIKEVRTRVNASYHQLIDFMAEKYLENGVVLTMQEMEIPDTVEELNRTYDVGEPSSAKLTLRKIKEDSIRAILLSCLASASDKTSQAAQLFEVYRQYDEALLRSATRRLHRQRIITHRKHTDHLHPSKASGHSPFKFSQRFSYLLNSKYLQSVYHEAYLELNRLLCCPVDTGMELDLHNCGPAAFVLASLGHIVLSVLVPEQFIVLDKDLIPAEASSKIMRRYVELLQHPDPSSAIKQEKVKERRPSFLASDEDEPPPKRQVLKTEHDQDEPSASLQELLSTPMEVEEISAEDTEITASTEPSIEAKVGFRSARIALYVLREIATREIDPTHRACRKPIDVFVVSTSKVFCSPTPALARDYGVCDGASVKRLLQQIVERADLYRYRFKMEEAEAELKRIVSGEQADQMRRLSSLITSCGVKGASLREVREMGEGAAGALRQLEDAGLVLRLGVHETRLVSRQHASTWAVRSFKLTRLLREKIKPLEMISGDAGTDVGSSGRSDAPKPIQIVMRPWLRVDGSVNRRVLDRLLGSVLGYIMLQPGLSTASVAAKFGIALSASWIRELVRILADIGCIDRRAIHTQKPTLFSKGIIKISDVLDGLESDEETLVEPKVDAIIKLGQFIGNKSYSKDILT